MAETKSVRFSPILEQPSDETVNISSDIGLFPEGLNFEDADEASLSKSAKKYRPPGNHDDEYRAPSRRKKALLVLGFILLLCIGGVAIYLITRELYNSEGYAYSGNVGKKNAGFPGENTTLQVHTSRLLPPTVINVSPEFSEEQISIKVTSSVPSQMTIFTAATIYEPSVVVTDFRSREQRGTNTSKTWIPLLTSSSKAALSSWLIEGSRDLSEIAATTKYLSETDVKKHKTSVGPSAAFSKSDASPTENLSWAFFQSMLDSTSSFGASKAKTPISLTEKSTFPLVLTESVNAQVATTSLKNVGTVVKSLPHSGLNYHTWSPTRNFVNRRSEMTHSDKSAAEILQHTLRRGSQTPLVHTSFTSVTRSSQGFSSNHLADDTMSSNHLLRDTKSTYISTSVKNSTLVLNPFTESLTSSSLEWTTSGPAPTSYMARNTSYDQISSNKISASSWSQRMAVKWQSSSSEHHASAASRQVSLSSNASWREVTSGVSPSLVKDTVISQSTLCTPQLSALIMSTTKWLDKYTIPPKTISQGIWRVVGTSTLSFSPFEREYSVIAGSGTINPTELGGAPSVHSTSKSTVSISVTWKRRKDASTTVLLKYKSMASSSISLYKAISTETLLSYLITQNSLSTNKDGSTTRTSSKTSVLLPTIAPSVTSAILLRSSVTSKVGSSASVFVKFPISSFSSNFYFRSVPTVASEVKRSNTESAQTLKFSFSSRGGDSSTVASKLTLKQKTSLSTFERPSSFLRLDSTGVPFGTSSFQHRKSTERPEQSLSQYNTPSVSTTKSHAILSHTLAIEARDPSLHSNFATTASISLHSSSSRLLSAAEMTPRKLNSLIVNISLPIVTSSIQHLGKSKDSIQESLSRYKTPSFATTTLQSTLHLSHTFTNSKGVRMYITTVSTTIRPTSLLQGLPSLASSFSIGVLSNVKSNGSLATHSPHPKANSTTSFILASNYTSTLKVRHAGRTVPYRFSSVLTTATPTSNVTSKPPDPFKVMDGSLIIRNKNYHTNLSNPGTTMFKILAQEVEAIITDIISLNNTNILDTEVTSFRSGSILADFYLKVRYESPLSDQEYAQLLSAANETLWRGFYVTNIIVILRASPEGTSATSQGKDDSSLSNTVIIATLTVLGALLIAVGSFGVYVCKKKGMCNISKVKPVDSSIPPSELEKIQPVRRGTWVTNDKPFLSVEVPTDPKSRSSSFYETLSLRVLERNDTEPDENRDPDSVRESVSNPFEQEYTKGDTLDKSTLGNANHLTSGDYSNSSTDNGDRPISGSSKQTYLKSTASSFSSSEDDRED